jgi:hypothetical protein
MQMRRHGPQSHSHSSLVLAVRPAPIEMDDEQKYRPIEWPLVRRLIRELAPFKREYRWGLALGRVQVL